MTSPLHIRSLRAFALSLIRSLFIAVGNLRNSFLPTRSSLAQRRCAFSRRQHAAGSRFAHSTFHRFACLAMIAVILVQGVLAPPQVSHAAVEAVSATVSDSWQSADHWWHSSGWA